MPSRNELATAYVAALARVACPVEVVTVTLLYDETLPEYLIRILYRTRKYVVGCSRREIKSTPLRRTTATAIFRPQARPTLS